MSEFFVILYRYFLRHRKVFYLFLLLLAGFISWFGSKIRLEEDISGLTRGNAKLSRYEYVIRNFRFADKLVVSFALSDSNAQADPDALVAAAGALRDSLHSSLDSSYIREIFMQLDDSLFNAAQQIIDDHLPLFLDDRDYQLIDSLMLPGRLESVLRSNYRLLVSPASLVVKQLLLKDPAGISGLAYKKLASLRSEDQFIFYNGCIFTPDLKHMLMFITPAQPSTETNKNSTLVARLDRYTRMVSSSTGNRVSAEYFGYAATAVGNAWQIKIDIILTLLIAVVLIFLLLGWYFRNFLVPLLGFVPAIVGGGLALAILYLVKGRVSFIALGIGSVILGLIIDYALYMVNHYRRKKSVEQVIRDMTQTIIICSLTTVGVFLCLIFLNSAVLHDLGWFTAISVLGASMCALVILPQLLGRQLLPKDGKEKTTTLIDRLAETDFGTKPWLIIGLMAAGVISLFFAGRAGFEKDMNSLNYLPKPLKKAEHDFDRISRSNMVNVYVVATGKNLDEALQRNERTQRLLETLKKEGKIEGYSGISTLLLSDSIQRVKLKKWREFWTGERKSVFSGMAEKLGKKIGFTGKAVAGIRIMTETSFPLIAPAQSLAFRKLLFSDWINETHDMTMVSGIVKVTGPQMQTVYKALEHDPEMVVFDRQELTTRFVLNVKHDFGLLVTLSMVFVTLLLLISFGRIELAVITSLPMFFSWLVTLGFMGITGIRFNIFNIIISTFIFGLGVDYSILMMRGMLSRYKTGIDDMKTYRVSIMLSSSTTLIGVGALFFARHPALNSIAIISIFGILSVVLISLSLQPLLANWMVLLPKQQGTYPMTLRYMVYAIFVAWIPISLIAVILVLYSTLVSPLLPIPRARKQELFHRIFCRLSSTYIWITFPWNHSIENPSDEHFSKPAIIICNHQSLIDTPALLRLHPKIVILTHEWVFRNRIFGPVARVAGFIPVTDSIDNSLELIRQRIDEGYSVLVFPEGHRSKDGHIQRFHRGAFYIAEKLSLDILPVMISGGFDFLPKGVFWGKPNRLHMKILPRIVPSSQEFGRHYSERTRMVRKYLTGAFETFRAGHATAVYYRRSLQLNYIYCGPVLEWYLRVKMILENNFDTWCRLIPEKGDILDLGCGYGYISYMLMLTSGSRTITGVDHDKQKITVAANGYLKNERITFIHADITKYPVTPKDAFLLGDVLHYLTHPQQESLIACCMRNLKPGGVILIREGDESRGSRHRVTRMTEFFSTKVFRFNKTAWAMGELNFTSAARLREIVSAYGFTFEVAGREGLTSNNFFVIRNPGDVIR